MRLLELLLSCTVPLPVNVTFPSRMKSVWPPVEASAISPLFVIVPTKFVVVPFKPVNVLPFDTVTACNVPEVVVWNVPAPASVASSIAPPLRPRLPLLATVTVPSVLRLPPSVMAPPFCTLTLLAPVATVRVEPPLTVSWLLGLISSVLIVASLLSVTLPVLVLPITTSDVGTGGPAGVHLVVSVVQ